MTVELFKAPSLPGPIAVSSVGSCIEDGTFLLDFSKPIKIVRGNKWVSFPTAISVPVIHQSQTEANAGYGVVVMRWTPEWLAIERLWKLTKAGPAQTEHVPTGEYSEVQVIADFAQQFPEFAQSV
jgi:hypothetical protein